MKCVCSEDNNSKFSFVCVHVSLRRVSAYKRVQICLWRELLIVGGYVLKTKFNHKLSCKSPVVQ